MTIFSGQQDTTNPFEITDSDVEESQFPGNILSDDEKNDAVDIELFHTFCYLFVLRKKYKILITFFFISFIASVRKIIMRPAPNQRPPRISA